ncbi:hypothetical protein KI688_003562 [Linnemannia hyalina]|uniref:Uncharacterized protein n=1 Tax=Linnemannia hyalina TaxID=64524 RepID=A0A9P8BPZ7_9FUNG|nr:hypothetical protein KI688_003562 [Linnemannia hyalina]
MPSFPIFKSFQQQQQTTTSTIDQPPTNTRRSSISAIVPPPGNIAGQTSSVFSDHVVHHAQLESVSSSSIAHESPGGRLLRSASLAAQYSQIPHQSGQQQERQQQSSWFGTGKSGQFQQHYNSEDMFMS